MPKVVSPNYKLTHREIKWGIKKAVEITEDSTGR